MKSTLITFLLTAIFSTAGITQNSADEKISHIDISLNFDEYKDQVHYGLVFIGLMPEFKYQYQKISGKNSFRYQTGFGLGIAKSRQLTAINVKFKPIQFDYNRLVKTSKNKLYAGFFTSLNYNYEISPWLHAGHTYWFSSLDFGPSLYFESKIKNIPIAFIFRNSILGFNSRPEYEKEDYFYKLNFNQVVENLHSNLSFTSINKRLFSQIEISLLNVTKRGWTFAYNFEYSAYYGEAKTSSFSNQIIFRKRIGSKK